MARGFVWAVYETDEGQLFRLRVDSDLVAQGDRGWLTVGAGTTHALPRGWLPRRVRGVDEVGNIRYTRIGRVDSPLWSGASTVFLVQGSDGVSHFATVVGRQRERQPPLAPPP